MIITPTQMFDEMREIGRKVDHLTSVVDPAIQNLRDAVTANTARIDVMAVRVTVLEHWRWFVLGFVAPIAAGAGYLLTRVFG